MLDIKTIRANAEAVQTALRRRSPDWSLESILAIDERRRSATFEMEQRRARQNAASQEIAKKKKAGESADDVLVEMKALSDEVKAFGEQASAADDELRDQLLRLPNLPDAEIPDGADESENRVERVVGDVPEFAFEPKDHVAIGEALGLMDFERAAKVTGSRFVVMTGQGALLERALTQFMLDVHTREHGYTEVLPPFMINSASMIGTGQLPKFGEDSFRLFDTDYWLAPTAEVPVTNIHREEILDEAQLPICYTAYTPCFRSEAGSYGRDTRGMIRMHQFNKVELVQFVRPDDSPEAHEALTGHAETILQRLKLPYRVVTLCTGDLGFSAAKTYDLEVWLPGQSQYREISSCSNFTDYQARRANIRYRPGGGKPEFVHTINGSGLAVGRTLVAVLENYQQADGTVVVPEALRPYMGGVDRLGMP